MLFCDFNCFSRAGGNFNEDAIFYNENLLIVMDAATTLTNVHFTPCESDGCWLSRKTVSMLAELLSDDQKPIADALRTVSETLKAELDALGCDKELSYPSGSIIIARIVDETVEIFSIGDCSAIIEQSSSSEEILIYDKAVAKLDGTVLAELEKMRKQSGKSIAELLPCVKEMLIENRNKRNKENGYWIFDPTGIAIKHGTTYKFSCTDVKSIALMSDGFYSISGFKNFSDNSKIIGALKSCSAQMLIDNIFDEFLKDDQLNKYPRFKITDDTSVVFARVK